MPVFYKLVCDNIPKILFGIVAAVLGTAATVVYADDAQVYSYDSISVAAVVNTDSTVDITETQTYNFQSGTFHKGWRSIPLEKISAITDIQVIDGETNEPLHYVSHSEDKTNPNNWGHFTYSGSGPVNIEWYYDVTSPATRTWIIKYKVHGALSFLKDHDELYWNLFTDYDVPVGVAEASVILPQDVTLPSKSMYIDFDSPQVAEQTDLRTFHFKTTNVPPQGKVTIAAGWQKGMIPVGNFWKDWFALYIGYIVAGIVAFGCLVMGIVSWFVREKYHTGRGTIIAEYDPPEQLPPAIGSILVTERIGTKAWPATIVDLAVRGYVKIVEERKPRMMRFLGDEKGFRIEKVKDYEHGTHLRPYEKQFLDILFGGGEYFSTIELAHASDSVKQAMFGNMQKLEKALYVEADLDTNAYVVPPSKRGLFYFALVSSIILFFFVFFGVGAMFASPYTGEWVVAILTSGISILGFYFTAKWNPRLNELGFRLRDDWKGFKLYLETAEKYRLQNLTPDLFEKFLPYAMIFSIEKKWAKAFDGMNMRAPVWYGAYGAGVYTGGSSDVSSGFSASAFSASFSSSLSSAFASSGASGASGGGGGAGGGGGGGGGGAS